MNKILLLLLLSTLLMTGCGKRGPLLPPEAAVPAAIADLNVHQKGGLFLVSWSAPGRDAGGKRLSDLAGFRVYRRVVLPPDQDCEECSGAYQLIRTVDLEQPEVRRSGNRFFFLDLEPDLSTTYQYKVVSYKGDGTVSGDSNRARRQKLPTPPAPRVRAVQAPSGATLEWQPPTIPAGMELVGYNVYRREDGAPISVLPLNAAPLPEPRFDDLHALAGPRYQFSVSTVVRSSGETLESDPSAESRFQLELSE